MTKKHLKRLSAPKTWPIKRKKIKFIARPLPGGHSFNKSTSLSVAIKDMLSYDITSKEMKNMLFFKQVLVDGKKRKDYRSQIGFMDVLSFVDINEHYRIIFSKKGKLTTIKISEKESKQKPCKITGKYTAKGGKILIRTHDGRTIPSSKNDTKIGDTVLIELPSQKIVDLLPVDKGVHVYLTGGIHIGEFGVIESVDNNIAVVKIEKKTVNVSIKFIFVIGKDKPLVKLQ